MSPHKRHGSVWAETRREMRQGPSLDSPFGCPRLGERVEMWRDNGMGTAQDVDMPGFNAAASSLTGQ